ncbi:probable ATP-dependent RNA helicase DHX35 isoform X2 [Hydra vulgaris]|uniref:RNA helicase n=1 Tax=Hydra vulgaris TaxID=6087 RepID=A0ABM4D5Q9_HYDVU
MVWQNHFGTKMILSQIWSFDLMLNKKNIFWKPGAEKPGIDLRTERQSEGEGAGSFMIYNPNNSLSIQQQRQRLPSFKYRNVVLYLLEKYQTVIISASTGSGKSTQIPQYLYEAGWTNDKKIIGVTQPRRVAVTSVASRVAEEIGTALGREVGYSIRFEDCTDKDLTKIKFLTDGYLVREMMADPLLSQYSVLMLDEVHERTLYTDVIIGLLKKILRKRPDLRLIISSATLDADQYQKFFNIKKSVDKAEVTSVILEMEGRTFPVDVYYLQAAIPNYVKSAVDTVISIHKTYSDGDILVFLTGQDEVENALQLIQNEINLLPKNMQSLLLLPLYGGLPMAEQLKVFQRAPPNTRKVVVSTNVAEASITISGIVYVIDSGFVKLKAYNAASGLDSLVITPISKASADQRSGRAGRVRAGKAYRLYPECEFNKLSLFTIPEIQRTNLASVILQLKSLGISNVLRFNFLSAPPAQLMINGIELLFALGALTEEGNLTEPLGVQMAEFPLNPMLSKMLLCSGNFQCSEEAVTLAAMLQIENVFVVVPNMKNKVTRSKLRFAAKEGDHLTLINVYRAFIKHGKSMDWCHKHFLNYKSLVRVVKVRNQLISILKQYDIPIVSCKDDDEAIRKCIISGFFANVAKYHPSGEYRTVRDNRSLFLHPSSVLSSVTPPPKLLIFNEVLCTSKDYMRDATDIKLSWLLELASSYYEYDTDLAMDRKKLKLDI